MTPPLPRRALTGTAATLLAGCLAVASTVGPAGAATIGGVKPVRSVAVGSDLPLMAVANDGTVYAASPSGSNIAVWAPSSSGVAPDVTKTFTGTNSQGQPQLDELRGLAYATDTPAPSIDVLDPSQLDGVAAPTRTITGALTQLDSPQAIAWTPNGSLWVEDTTSTGNPELLRFAPNAHDNVAPVQRIFGAKAELVDQAVIGTTGFLAGMPDNGVAFAPATVGTPTILIFGGSQTGNVAPAHTVSVLTPSPHWLSEGLASDSLGRLYIGSGDVDGNSFGRLDVYSKTGQPIVTLGGTAERFQVPIAPTVAHNGTLALLDALIINISGSSTSTSGRAEIYRPLFAKPGAVTALKVVKSSSKQTISWKAPSNPGGTPPSYTVVIKKGTTTVLSKKVSGTSLVVARSALPSGLLKVTVTAVNLGGSSAGASTSFSN